MRDTIDWELHEREIAFATLAEIAPVGIMRFDSSGRCNYVNERWSTMSGLTVDEAVGEGWTSAIHPADRRAVVARWKRLRRLRGAFREEYRLCPADGSVRWVLGEGAALTGYAGEPLGFIRAITDITRHRELEAELLAARADLEQRVRERTAALQHEIHERQKLERDVLEAKDNEHRRFSQDLHDGLGQNLTGILFLALALQRRLEDEKSPLAAKARQMAELLNTAINEAHNVARGIDPVPLRCDGLKTALEDLIAKVRLADGRKCILKCDSEISVENHSAANHVFRIAQEAIANALKHSGASKISVELRRARGGCLLRVKDDGAGLSTEAKDRTGRGLNIMKHRASVIGADFSVHSNPGAGTIMECFFQP